MSEVFKIKSENNISRAFARVHTSSFSNCQLSTVASGTSIFSYYNRLTTKENKEKFRRNVREAMKQNCADGWQRWKRNLLFDVNQRYERTIKEIFHPQEIKFIQKYTNSNTSSRMMLVMIRIHKNKK